MNTVEAGDDKNGSLNKSSRTSFINTIYKEGEQPRRNVSWVSSVMTNNKRNDKLAIKSDGLIVIFKYAIRAHTHTLGLLMYHHEPSNSPKC